MRFNKRILKILKLFILPLVLTTLFGLSVTSVHAGSIFDTFNDITTNNWVPTSPGGPYNSGHWWVDGGRLYQDQPGDHYKLLLGNFQISTQSVETDVYNYGPAGYGGITVWFQDSDNWVDVFIYGGIDIIEKVNGVSTVYHYLDSSYHDNTQYRLRVDADGTTGEIQAFINGTLITSHQTSVVNTSGLSGLNSGNTGSYFDNFMITSDSIVGPPIDKTQCKKDGWSLFNNPTFKNQGACVSYVVSNENAGKRQ